MSYQLYALEKEYHPEGVVVNRKCYTPFSASYTRIELAQKWVETRGAFWEGRGVTLAMFENHETKNILIAKVNKSELIYQ